jgi:hypothetical protein
MSRTCLTRSTAARHITGSAYSAYLVPTVATIHRSPACETGALVRLSYVGKLEAGVGIEPTQAPSKGAGLPLAEPAANWCPVTVTIRVCPLERRVS